MASIKAFLVGRIKSACFALAGVRTLLVTQVNARLHLCATAAVVAAGLFFNISPEEWRWLVMAITIVWICEAFNTAFEFLADTVAPEFHPGIRRAKDIAAAAVLFAAVGASLIGLLTLGPHVLEFLRFGITG